MIKFDRYPHIKELLTYYAERENRSDIIELINNDVTTEGEAESFSRFVWQVAGLVNDDEENAIEVLGSIDNTDMLPDLSYEISTYMKSVGYYPIWQRISDQEMQ